MFRSGLEENLLALIEFLAIKTQKIKIGLSFHEIES
jgi:hypothetical protein